MNTVISKRLSTFTYQDWKVVNGQAVPNGPGILINGGAGVVGGLELLSGNSLENRTKTIPVGVHTYVSDEVLDKLLAMPKFRKDMERGLIAVVRGEKCGQDRTDEIARTDMLGDEHIKHRPFSQKDIEDAGGKINKDGSVDISEAVENIEALRASNAGLPNYVQKRNLEELKTDKVAKKRAYTRRKKD